MGSRGGGVSYRTLMSHEELGRRVRKMDGRYRHVRWSLSDHVCFSARVCLDRTSNLDFCVFFQKFRQEGMTSFKHECFCLLTVLLVLQIWFSLPAFQKKVRFPLDWRISIRANICTSVDILTYLKLQSGDFLMYQISQMIVRFYNVIYGGCSKT